MSQIDKRIKVNTIIENQLPEFVVTDFPNATEFLKQYYISQEFQGGAQDLITNFDQYLSLFVMCTGAIISSTASPFYFDFIAEKKMFLNTFIQGFTTLSLSIFILFIDNVTKSLFRSSFSKSICPLLISSARSLIDAESLSKSLRRSSSRKKEFDPFSLDNYFIMVFLWYRTGSSYR